MYAREVFLRIKRESVHSLTDIYTRNVLPALRETNGCLFGSLMQDVHNSRSCSTLTVWRSREDSSEYEKSGLYHKLLLSLRHLFGEPAEWRVDADILHLEYEPSPERPAVVGMTGPRDDWGPPSVVPTFIHVLTIRAHQAAPEPDLRLFEPSIRQVLQNLTGFQSAYLLRRVDDSAMLYLLSFWSAAADPTQIVSPAQRKRIEETCGPVGGNNVRSSVPDPRPRLLRCIAAEWFSPDHPSVHTEARRVPTGLP